MCHRRAMVLALLVPYNKFICDTRNTEAKNVLLNAINITISYVVFLIYIFFFFIQNYSSDEHQCYSIHVR